VDDAPQKKKGREDFMQVVVQASADTVKMIQHDTLRYTSIVQYLKNDII
jgi:hypothetical protein